MSKIVGPALLGEYVGSLAPNETESFTWFNPLGTNANQVGPSTWTFNAYVAPGSVEFNVPTSTLEITFVGFTTWGFPEGNPGDITVRVDVTNVGPNVVYDFGLYFSAITP